MVNERENQYDDEIEGARSGWSAPHPISITDFTADTTLYGQACRLCGWSVRETAGSAAKMRFWDSGTIGQGNIVGTVGVAANLSDTQWLGDGGIICVGGLSADLLGGALELVVWIRHAMI